MNQKIIVRVSANQELKIPREIKRQLQPLSEYEIVFNQDEIVFKKIKKTATNQFLRPASGKSILRHAEGKEMTLKSVYKLFMKIGVKLNYNHVFA